MLRVRRRKPPSFCRSIRLSISTGDAPVTASSSILQGFGDEQLFGREAPLRNPLLVVVAQEGVERVPIALEPVRPEIVAHQSTVLLAVLGEPGHHEETVHVRLLHTVELASLVLRFL